MSCDFEDSVLASRFSEHGELLFQSVVVDVGHQLRDAFEPLHTHAGTHFRQSFGNLRGQLHQACTTLLERVAEAAAFAVAKAREFGQGLGKQGMGRGNHGRRVARVVPHHARPAQQLHHVDPGRVSQLRRR